MNLERERISAFDECSYSKPMGYLTLSELEKYLPKFCERMIIEG
jgi:hypothetical protein